MTVPDSLSRIAVYMGRLSLGILGALWPLAVFAAGPEAELATLVKTFYSKAFVADWAGIEKLPGVQWAPLPPTMLQNCLPDGGCFTRQGRLAMGGRNIVVIATGARTMVNNVYLRNMSEPFGEQPLLDALKTAGISAELARCPVPGTAGGTNWYKLKSPAANPGVLSVQTSCNGKPCEGFVLTQGAGLPALQPVQLKLYSEQCSAPPAERQAVAAAGLPHEWIARLLVAAIPPASGPPLYGWKNLHALPAKIQWAGAAPLKADLSYRGDPNPLMLSGQTEFAGRRFSITASGSATEVKILTLEEMGMHPRGEHVLGEVYKEGVQVQLVKCGPVYTASTNNWYSLKSPNHHPALIRQSIQYEGNQVADTYELRLDNSQPKADPRDRAPGVNNCR